MTELPPRAAKDEARHGEDKQPTAPAQPVVDIGSSHEPSNIDEWGLPIPKRSPPMQLAANDSTASLNAPMPPALLSPGSPAQERAAFGRSLSNSPKISVQSEVERIERLEQEVKENEKEERRLANEEEKEERQRAREQALAAAAATQTPSGNVADVLKAKGVEDGEILDKLANDTAKVKLSEPVAVTLQEAIERQAAEERKKDARPPSPSETPNVAFGTYGDPAPGLVDKADDLSASLAQGAAEYKGHSRKNISVNTINHRQDGHLRTFSKESQFDGAEHKRTLSLEKPGGGGVSEWSHQAVLTPNVEATKEEEKDEWQEMPAYAPYDIYDDDNKLIAREAHESDEEANAYAGLGGAGKGYTRVQLDDDAQSATSMDENTQYLFKEAAGTHAGVEDDDEARDAMTQMQATKDLLTEGQRIAYVGMTRLVLSAMVKKTENVENVSKGAKKECALSTEAMRMWSQKMMIRLYSHMEISPQEQIMIEQLDEHGVVPEDLTPTLMANARVKNPMAEDEKSEVGATKNQYAGRTPDSVATPRRSTVSPPFPRCAEEESASPPPNYEEVDGEHLPEVRTPNQLPTTKNIDIDLRWTVLCDLFLTLIMDSVYDSRSRVLLERVGEHLDITWLDICRFEKRVTDALEMQQAAEKENWNEDEHKENRRKMAIKKRYVMMGLATVGGGLVIGLSAGLLAPVIGAGLAAGFGAIGVSGTAGFLAGAGGAAIITSAAATSGGVIAVRAADRRTGAVKTFEYRPLHNNKRVNLIVTVSGWMTGKMDDVRLPYSTVDPTMGDIYSVLWEPEMLRSMGATINILATEALAQGLQQVLAATFLMGLMSALQLPVVLTKLSYFIDNPWTVSLTRAEAAGLILADSLIDRNLGTRPITFVGYSLGARVIFFCLRELSRRGAYGLVQNVYLFGSPIVAKRDEYFKARSVVAGRFVNGYSRNDWILGYLFRLTSGGISRIAGLAPVEDIEGLENIDVTDIVTGHMEYRTAMPKLLEKVGWLVDSLEFSEIEDPDPENHNQRQRELIDEIEEARRNFEEEQKEKDGKKGGAFGWLTKKKKTAVVKKEWETYEKNDNGSGSGHGSGDEGLRSMNDFVLFDIDAIRKELESENYEVKELQSTLPPMKLDLNSSTPASPANRGSVRASKSADAVPTRKMSYEYDYDDAADGEPQPVQCSKHGPETSKMKPGKPHTYAYAPDEGYKSYHASPMIHEESEVAMSFDTAYTAPPTRSQADSPYREAPPAQPFPPSISAGLDIPESSPWVSRYGRSVEVSVRNSRDTREDDPWKAAAENPLPLPEPERPAMKGSWTAPIILQGRQGKSPPTPQPPQLEMRNAWADDYDDDDDEFKEKEVTMTFG